jgi:AcrR family transcriptional regulator
MELDVPAKRRATTKGDATREAVKQAAKRAIASDGFAAVTIADIMSQAGKSPGAFYLYFKSKEVLLHELLEEFRVRLKAEVNRPFDEGEGALDTLATRLGAFWKIYRDDWPIATAAFQMSMVDQQFARAWRNVRQQGIRGVSSLILLAKKRGYAPDLDTELAASAMCSMLEYTCYNWTAKGGDFPDRFIDDATAIKVLSHLFINALGGSTVPVGSRKQRAASAI